MVGQRSILYTGSRDAAKATLTLTLTRTRTRTLLLPLQHTLHGQPRCSGAELVAFTWDGAQVSGSMGGPPRLGMSHAS